MKRIFYFLLLMFVFSLISTQAQIVIDSNEYNTTPGTKHYLYSYTDSSYSGFAVNVGSAGANQTWSYTSEQFPGGQITAYTVVDPAGTPAASDFPGAHHAWYSQEDTMALYQYFKYNSSELSYMGMAFVGDSISLLQSNPPERLLVFPAAYNSSWQNNTSSRTGTPGEFEWVDSTVSTSLIDAWGTITIPSGTYSCLRVKENKVYYTMSYVYGMLIYADTTSEISYSWFAENTGFLASITSLDNETDDDFSLAGDITIRTNGDVAIGDEQNLSVQSFELKQNYPNPFNPSTTIEYTLAQGENVELAVYNQLGQKVAGLFKGPQDAGLHAVTWNAQGFASGVYFYQLKTGSGRQITKKLLLMQ